MKKIREVIRLHLDRRASVREIAAACGIGRTTVGEYLLLAKPAVVAWQLAEELLMRGCPGCSSLPPTASKPARPMPDWSFVQKATSKGLVERRTCQSALLLK